MANEPDSNTEPTGPTSAEVKESKSNAVLVGIALNLGRATRVLTNGFGAIGQTAKKIGSGTRAAAERQVADTEAAEGAEPPGGAEIGADEQAQEDEAQTDEMKKKKAKK